MKITYKGIHHDLPEKLQEKLDLKFQKLAKLLDGPGGEKAAHVILTQERRLHKAEITLRYYGHQLVGAGSDGDIFNAMSGALAKLEKQAVKQRGRWREKIRRSAPEKSASTKGGEAPEPAPSRPRIFRVRAHERRKPMTLDEALLQMEDGRAYLVYRDVEQERVTTLVRRPDGNFDLIEA
jgi:putative sigma-54 modulation protein